MCALLAVEPHFHDPSVGFCPIGGMCRSHLLPLWVPMHPIFVERMAEATPLISVAAASFQALEDTARIVKGIAREIRRSSAPPGASLFAWEAHWLDAARQAWAWNDDSGVRRRARRVGNYAELLLAPTGAVRAEIDDGAVCEAIRRLRHHQISVDMSM